MTAAGPAIRAAAAPDLDRIGAIYARHVLEGVATFDETPPGADETATRHARIAAAGLPYLVAETEGGVAGFAYAAPYHPRSGYRFTVEDSVYVAPEATGRGIGGALLAGLISRTTALGFRQMVAVIGDSGNAASIRLHARQGFRHVGTLEAVGFKFGRWLDCVLMQRPLAAPATSGLPPSPPIA